MVGFKSMREKSKGILDAVEERRAKGEQPVGKPAPETPLHARTSPGRMFGLQDAILQAEERARKAEEDLEHLKASAGSSVELEAAMARLQQTETALKEAEEALQEAMKNLPVRKAKLTELHEVPGRRRKLSQQQYEELRENLRHNPLTNPVTVRIREEGGYEIVAGYNRVSCYRDLERDEIDINILDLDDDETERAAFYSNLLAPSLPDYEKFVGFRARMEKHGLTQTQVAEEAGVSQSFISSLMAFGDLPVEALATIAEAPELFGAKAIQQLAKFAKQGRGGQVTEAVRKIAIGELTQSAAVQFAGASPVAVRPERSVPVMIRQGKSKYCEVVRAEKTIRLSFASADEAEATFAAIREVLERRASSVQQQGDAEKSA